MNDFEERIINTPNITEKSSGKSSGKDNTCQNALKTRNELLKECKEQGIKIPRNATVKQLNDLLDEH